MPYVLVIIINYYALNIDFKETDCLFARISRAIGYRKTNDFTLYQSLINYMVTTKEQSV